MRTNIARAVFHPKDIFEHAFQESLLQVQRTLKRSDFTYQIKYQFQEMVQRNRIKGIASAHSHSSLLSTKFDVWKAVSSDVTCYCCLLRVPAYSMECRHRLCSSCVQIFGQAIEPWCYRLDRCVLCHHGNSTVFVLNPPTAGIRTLKLGGLRPENTLQFLRDLQHTIGLTTVALSEYFDVVIATELGMSVK